MAAGIVIVTKSATGNTPISSTGYVLSVAFPNVSYGVFMFFWNILLLLGQVLILRRRFQPLALLQIPISVLFSLSIDGFASLLSWFAPANYAESLGMLALGIITLAAGVSLTVVANVAMNCGEALVAAITSKTGWNFGHTKVGFDISCVIIACAVSLATMGNVTGVREGTVAAAVLTGFVVNFFVRKGKDLEERFIGNAYMFTPKDRKALLKIHTNAPDPMAITKPYYDQVKDQDDVTKMQYLDLHLWMAGDILLKADKMSMANSLELRVPFLDKEVMALAQRIPTRYRVIHKPSESGGTPYITKYAMRLAAKKDTPPQTAKTAAKKKLGFPVPIRVWLKEDTYYNMVKNTFEGNAAQQFFHTEKLVQLLDDHRAGKADNSRKIWTVYMFLVWYHVYFESDVIPTKPNV